MLRNIFYLIHQSINQYDSPFFTEKAFRRAWIHSLHLSLHCTLVSVSGIPPHRNTLSLFFKIMKNVKEANPYCLPIHSLISYHLHRTIWHQASYSKYKHFHSTQDWTLFNLHNTAQSQISNPHSQHNEINNILDSREIQIICDGHLFLAKLGGDFNFKLQCHAGSSPEYITSYNNYTTFWEDGCLLDYVPKGLCAFL